MSWFKKTFKKVGDFAVKGLKTAARVVTTGGAAVLGTLVGGPAGGAAAGAGVNKLWSSGNSTVKNVAQQAMQSTAVQNNLPNAASAAHQQATLLDLGNYIKFPTIQTDVTAKTDNNSIVKIGLVGAALLALGFAIKKF